MKTLSNIFPYLNLDIKEMYAYMCKIIKKY